MCIGRQVHFERITFCVPLHMRERERKGTDGFKIPKLITGRPVSYRHMIRFFFFKLLEHPAMEQMKFYWRLDAHSEVMSKIDVDIFKCPPPPPPARSLFTPAPHRACASAGVDTFRDQLRNAVIVCPVRRRRGRPRPTRRHMRDNDKKYGFVMINDNPGHEGTTAGMEESTLVRHSCCPPT